MSTSRTTGLGNPEPIGKAALFQPPKQPNDKPKQDKPRINRPVKKKPPQRVRTTLSLTRRALSIIQHMQHHHRLMTGKALEMWIIVSKAIEYYGKHKGVEPDEPTIA